MAKSDVASIYETIGRDFSRTRMSNWPEVKVYLKQVKTGQSVLDLGCGNGRLNFDLPSEVDYTGVDVSKVLIDEAKRLFPMRKFVVGDALEYKSEIKFDAVFCVAVVHHLSGDEVKRVMRVMRESMGDKGFAVITCWNLWQKRYLKYQLKSLGSKLTDWRKVTVPYQKTDRACVAWTRWDLQKMARDECFTTVKVESEPRNIVLYLRK